MILHRIRPALVALPLLVSTACFVSTKTGQIMQQNITQLQTDVTSLRHDLAEARAMQTEQMAEALKKMEEMSGALQEFNHSSRLTDADFGSQMERIIHDVQDLRGAVEVNEHRLGETETKLDETLAQRVDALKKDGGGASETSASAESAMPKDKKEALAYAQKLAKDGKSNDARSVWRALIKQFPKEVGVADESLYRLGESYSRDENWEAALREYIKIVDKFSAGPLVDDAYYQIGISSLQLNRLEDAQTFFSEVVTNHKKSPLFKAAKAKLDEVTKRLDAQKKAARGKKR